MLDDRCELGRRGREIEQSVACSAPVAVELLEPLAEPRITVRVAELGLMVNDALRERVPHRRVDGAEPRMLLDRLPELGAELIVGFWPTRESDDGEPTRKLSLVREVVEGGNEFAMGEVARRAENHQRARLGCPPCAESLAKWIGRQLSFVHGQRLATHLNIGRRTPPSGFTAGITSVGSFGFGDCSRGVNLGRSSLRSERGKLFGYRIAPTPKGSANGKPINRQRIPKPL